MGALADAIVAYAQPLLDQTDGSLEQMNKAFAICQLCYNLALLPEDRREMTLSEMRPTLQMDDEEFDAFRHSIVIPMIRRHQEMFPKLHRQVSTDAWQSGPSLQAQPRMAAATDPWQSGPSVQAQPRMAAAAEKYPGTDRYAPCPCNSGQKYKFCCGVKRR